MAAGRIIEKVTGKPMWDFLESRILRPLNMKSAIDLDQKSLGDSDASGYTRFGVGPARPATPEGRGWVYGAGELAMTAHDLALWDLSLIDRKLLKPASLDAMMTPVRLRNGTPTGYALGVQVSDDDGHPVLRHGGAVSGFATLNTVWLDQRAAVAVQVNVDGVGATIGITNAIQPLLLAEVDDPNAARDLEQARRNFSQLQEGKIDRSLIDSDLDAYFTPQVLADAASSLKPLGTPVTFTQTGFGLRGGMPYRNFRIGFNGQSLRLSTFTSPNGKLAQYLIQ